MPAVKERPASLDQLVIDRGLAPAETLARARLVQSETGERLDAVLTRLGRAVSTISIGSS